MLQGKLHTGAKSFRFPKGSRIIQFTFHDFFYDANLQSDIFRTYALIEANTLWKATKVKFMLNLAKI